MQTAALVLPVAAACTDSTTTILAPTISALTPAAAAAVDTAIQDEFHAEQIYLRVLADHGNVLPLFNVVVAEQRHSAALAGVLERRGR